MSKKILITIGVVALVLIGYAGFYELSQKTAVETTTGDSNQNNTDAFFDTESDAGVTEKTNVDEKVEVNVSTANETTTTTETENEVAITAEPNIQTSLFANGCFWCVESDLQKVPGVKTVVSGYADGTNKKPTYENYDDFGHREVVEVTYDASVVSYGNLVEHILKHGDVTDPDGSFGDRGPEYAPAIYFGNETERKIAVDVIAAVSASNVYGEVVTIKVIPDSQFWIAEDYHQDYAEKNPVKYYYYRTASGRTAFIEKYWGNRATAFEFSS